MNTLTLSPAAGRPAQWAVRAGLALARWGRRRAARRTDRDRLLRRAAGRAAAEAATAERDRTIRSATFPSM
ncbi:MULTISPECIES: hypothetical protein [unclassified Agromyces]|uniref:hypothetical protein n=1 Tax=unclassified Agromyces TaxID=2639701 RepID=UPI003014F52E